MLDAKLLLAAMIQSREAYEEIKRLGTKASGGPLWDSFYRAIEKYYDSDSNVPRVEREYLRSWAQAEFAENPKHFEAHKQYLSELPQDVSGIAVSGLARRVAKDAVRGKLSLACANGSPDEEIEKIIKEYQAVGSGETSDAISSELIDVAEYMLNPDKDDRSADRFKLWPKPLNDAVAGRCGRGNHILIFAYTNTGKTTFTANLVAGFIAQNLKVLYNGNEENALDRICSRLLKVPVSGLGVLTPEQKTYLESTLGKLHYQRTDRFSDVRKILETQPHDVVVLDQLRNMKVRSESRTVELEAAANEARAVAREYNCLVVSVTQGTAESGNKVYLGMPDVDSSKVGIPGATDVMIGLGADETMRQNGLLGVSICKSKFGPSSRFLANVNFTTGVVQ